MDFRRSVEVGGTVVTVAGSNFVASALLRCKFNSTVVVATFVSASSCRCVTPAHDSGHVYVDVSNNNQDYTQRVCSSSTSVRLFFFSFATSTLFMLFALCVANVEVYELYPPRGPVYGNTTVTVFGREFLDMDMRVASAR